MKKDQWQFDDIPFESDERRIQENQSFIIESFEVLPMAIFPQVNRAARECRADHLSREFDLVNKF